MTECDGDMVIIALDFLGPSESGSGEGHGLGVAGALPLRLAWPALLGLR